MNTVYILTPLAKNSFTQVASYKREKFNFSVITTWKHCSLIVDKLPRSRTVNGNKIANLTDFKFKDNQFNYKSKLVLPDDLPDDVKKEIKIKFKENCLFDLEDTGWKFTGEKHILSGEFESTIAPVHKLTLFTSQMSLVCHELTKSEYKDYAGNGMQQSTYDDFMDDELVCEPMFDELTMLSIDDSEVPNFNQDFKNIYTKSLKKTKFNKTAKLKNKYAFVNINWIKHSWYETYIYEEFDLAKLHAYIDRDNIFGTKKYIETFTLSYGKNDFEFLESHGANSTECYLTDSKGNRMSFDVIDDSDCDEHEELDDES